LIKIPKNENIIKEGDLLKEEIRNILSSILGLYEKIP